MTPQRSGSRWPDPEERRAAATDVAVAALCFIASEPERLGRFLALTGIGPQSIREAAQEPDFLLGVLDHLAGDESLLIAFAKENGIAPEQVTSARNVLAGSPQDP